MHEVWTVNARRLSSRYGQAYPAMYIFIRVFCVYFAFGSAFVQNESHIDSFCAAIVLHKSYKSFHNGPARRRDKHTIDGNRDSASVGLVDIANFSVSISVRNNFLFSFFAIESMFSLFVAIRPSIGRWLVRICAFSVVAKLYCHTTQWSWPIPQLNCSFVVSWCIRWCWSREKYSFRWNLCAVKMCQNHSHLWTETEPSINDGLWAAQALNLNAPRSLCNESL